MLFLRREQEIVQELGDTHLLSVTQIHVFGDRLHHVDHFHLLIELQAILTVITETNGLADIEMAAIGSHLPHQHLDKGRFARTVIPDNTHLLVTGENIVEILRNLQITETFAYIHRLENLRTNVRSLHVQVHLSGIPLLLRFLFQLIKGIDTVLRFRAPCLRLAAHPIQFRTEKILRALHVGVHRLDTLLAFLQIITIITFIRIDLLIIDLDDLTTNTIQEVTVVRHHQDTDIGPAQIIFQPFGHLQIQMVRRLIQDNQFRVRDQDIRQGYPFQLSSGQFPDLLIEVMNLQLPEDLFRLLLIIPRLEAIHTGKDVLQIRMILFRHRLLVLSDQPDSLVLRVEASL